jgi:ribonuclease-3
MFLETKESRDSEGIFLIELFLDRVKRGEGRGKKIIDAEQIASQEVLDYLRSIGIFKEKVEKMKYIDERMIYKAPRDIHFVNFISNLLKTVYFLKDLELDQDDISIFAKAFTHPDVSKDNYEFLETLGDNTNNKCVLWYLSNRFPQLNCPDGIDIITKLKINIIKTESFSAFAEELSFFNYISLYKKEQLGNWERKEILEDVFEAFFAAVEIVVNKKYKYGMGYIACYKLMSIILDTKEYNIQYTDIVSAKTRLKELFDSRKEIKIKYLTNSFIQQNDKIYTSFILESRLIGVDTYSQYKKIGNPSIFGEGNTDKQAEEDVSKKAIEYYKSMNIIKHIPKEYLKFCV